MQRQVAEHIKKTEDPSLQKVVERLPASDPRAALAVERIGEAKERGRKLYGEAAAIPPKAIILPERGGMHGAMKEGLKGQQAARAFNPEQELTLASGVQKSPQGQKAMNVSGVMHEGFEGNRGAFSPSFMKEFGHRNPGVITSESNLVAALKGPGATEAKKGWKGLREAGGEAAKQKELAEAALGSRGAELYGQYGKRKIPKRVRKALGQEQQKIDQSNVEQMERLRATPAMQRAIKASEETDVQSKLRELQGDVDWKAREQDILARMKA